MSAILQRSSAGTTQTGPQIESTLSTSSILIALRFCDEINDLSNEYTWMGQTRRRSNGAQNQQTSKQFPLTDVTPNTREQKQYQTNDERCKAIALNSTTNAITKQHNIPATVLTHLCSKPWNSTTGCSAVQRNPANIIVTNSRGAK